MAPSNTPQSTALLTQEGIRVRRYPMPGHMGARGMQDSGGEMRGETHRTRHESVNSSSDLEMGRIISQSLIRLTSRQNYPTKLIKTINHS